MRCQKTPSVFLMLYYSSRKITFLNRVLLTVWLGYSYTLVNHTCGKSRACVLRLYAEYLFHNTCKLCVIIKTRHITPGGNLLYSESEKHMEVCNSCAGHGEGCPWNETSIYTPILKWYPTVRANNWDLTSKEIQRGVNNIFQK